ncbi:hypothetical protein AB0M20_25645 [Actinoplanes sp. NPDC051633]|uniref:hypothetical protein n=1 Tax=Actinoplanes sp. NPDC051633 TaxID=3155670 RepID=UPI00343E6E8F
MTDSSRVDEARSGLPDWAADLRDNFDSVIEVVGAPPGEADSDPVSVLPYLQSYINELPLEEFENSDWATLHTDIVSFLARVMAVDRRATWQVREAPNSPRGYRYVLRATDAQGNAHDVDPFEVVAQEFQRRPIDVARMVADTELSLGATPIDNN